MGGGASSAIYMGIVLASMPIFVSLNGHLLQRPDPTHGESIDESSHHQSPVIRDSGLYNHPYESDDAQHDYCHLPPKSAGEVA